MNLKKLIFLLIAVAPFATRYVSAQNTNIYEKDMVFIADVVDNSDRKIKKSFIQLMHSTLVEACAKSQNYDVLQPQTTNDIANELASQQLEPTKENILKLAEAKGVKYIIFVEVKQTFSAYGNAANKINIDGSLYRVSSGSAICSEMIPAEPNDRSLISKTYELVQKLLNEQVAIPDRVKLTPEQLYNQGLAFQNQFKFSKSIEYLKYAAEDGHLPAYYTLGECYFNGKGVKKDYQEAINWYTLGAAKSDAASIHKLALCYKNGYGVEADPFKALESFAQAAELGYAESQYELASAYKEGVGIPQDMNAAIQWLTKSAEGGYLIAQKELAERYKNGEGVSKNFNKSAEWIRRAAEQGDLASITALGNFYFEGKISDPDYNEAAVWYSKGAVLGDAYNQYMLGLCYYKLGNRAQAIEMYKKAAAQGYADAQCEIGYCYNYGVGVEENKETAIKWYTLAANQGHDYSMHGLADIYDGWGSYDEAIKWYRKSAELNGEYAAHSSYKIGTYYENGFGVAKDINEALKWHRKASELGEPDGTDRIGDFYHKGIGVEQNFTEALKWYNKAIEQYGHIVGGDAIAYKIGKIYYNGDGVTQNYEEAIKWFKKSTELYPDRANSYIIGKCYLALKNYDEAVKHFRLSHLGEAKYELGLCYYNGTGVETNYNEAFKLFVEAVNWGHEGDKYLPDAQYMLGRCYCNSRGVNENPEEAYKLFSKAAEKNHNEAQLYLFYCYNDGYGVEQSLNLALEWLTKSANNGCGEAAYELAIAYGDTQKGERLGIYSENLAECSKWMHKSAELGYPKAYLQLGLLYYEGYDSIEIDYKKAVYWLSLAAEHNLYYATYLLAECYYNGTGTDQDYEKAVKLYKNCDYFLAHHKLGDCYYYGLGVQNDYETAVKWYNKALENVTENISYVGAHLTLYQLGLCYSYGYGVKKDIKVAYELFKKATEQHKDYAPALRMIGWLYDSINEYNDAVHYFARAAEQGDEEAILFLGNYYFCGKSVIQDYVQAAKLFEILAHKNNVEAQYLLAECYMNGVGENQKIPEAIKWYKTAAAQGHEGAKQKLQAMNIQ